MTGDVAALATGFVAELNALFDGVFGVPEAFTSILVGGDDASRIGIAPFDSERRGFGLFALKRQVDAEARLFLRVEFDVALDDDTAHLMVRKSTLVNSFSWSRNSSTSSSVGRNLRPPTGKGISKWRRSNLPDEPMIQSSSAESA